MTRQCIHAGGQEPGSNAQIKSFAQQRGAKFQMFEKVEVNGKNGERWH
jgi:glutathione peroxidase-family protein